MNTVIENDQLRVSVKSKGAELFSVVNKKTGLEYMWSGDPAFWGKTSPVLFPIVGTLKDDTFLFKNRKYNLTRHGFARESEFEITESEKDRVVFTLISTASSIEKYPFEFTLKLEYTIKENYLHVNYWVMNSGTEEMYFSIGAHPAFKVPLVEGTAYTDYDLIFNKVEHASRWPISSLGLIESSATPFLDKKNKIHLEKSLFLQDAVVLKHLESDMVSIKSPEHEHGLDFYFAGFPFLGIWAAKNADFVCIEPWCGIADSVTHNQQLASKEGIEKVTAGNSWSREWRARFY